MATQDGAFDYLITDARIVDGTGSPWYAGDLAIKDQRIAAIGDLGRCAAEQIVHAEGRYLVPGFIDAHIHSELALLHEPAHEPTLRQGITSHIIGQDGISYAPGSATTVSAMHRYFAAVNGEHPAADSGRSVGGFLGLYDGNVAANVGYLLPHGAIRAEVVGHESRPPTPQEVDAMQQLIRQGMRDGALGLSTGLDYVPCRHADTDELVALARAAGEYAGIFVAHMRGYGPAVNKGLDEMYRVAREAGVPIHVSHFNVPAELGIELIEAGRASGVDVTFDQYPYLAGSSTLALWLPDDVHTGTVESILEMLRTHAGRERVVQWFNSGQSKPLDSIRFSHLTLPEHKQFLGQTPPEAARAAGMPIGQFLHGLLVTEQLRPGVIAFVDAEWRSEEGLRKLMVHPAQMVGSDGIYVGDKPHPRGWGSVARFLATYVRDERVLALEDAVRRLTSFPARRFGLQGRGLLVPGMYADLSVFDLHEVRANATYADGRKCADGFSHVFVNGRPVISDTVLTGELPGRSVRNQAVPMAN